MIDLGLVLINAGFAALAALAVVLVAFGFGAAMRRHRVVDIAWGCGFAAIAVTTFALSAGHGDATRRLVVTALTVVWGLRLAIHIGLRARGTPEDPRYVAYLSRAKGNPDWYALRMVYLLQGASMLIISAPVQVAQYDPDRPSALFWLGVAVWAVGFAFEAVGDHQLVRFAGDPANRGRVLDHGLWRYTRHPNYFGDSVVWWGLYLLACGSWPGVATIFSPLFMTWLLARKTGKPLMESHLSRSRPGYAEYVARTSGFFPRPPRRNATGTTAT